MEMDAERAHQLEEVRQAVNAEFAALMASAFRSQTELNAKRLERSQARNAKIMVCMCECGVLTGQGADSTTAGRSRTGIGGLAEHRAGAAAASVTQHLAGPGCDATQCVEWRAAEGASIGG